MATEDIWKPNPGVQEFALRVPSNVFQILYGGSRGGGKTDAGIFWLIKPTSELDGESLVTHPKYRGLVLRRNANDLTDWLDRAEQVYSEYGAKLIKHPQPSFKFPSGAIIYAGHLKDEDAYTKYQGHEYQRILIEELTQIKSDTLYTKLIASCRSTVEGVPAQVFLTTNPGGKGHGWVKKKFIDPAPPKTFFKDKSTGRPAIFIPARIEDNPKLMEADPHYVEQMDALKEVDESLWKAWRLGQWDAFEGQVFREWRYDKHVFNEFWFDLNKCERICAFDWGYRDPAVMIWLAYTPPNSQGVRHLMVYREITRMETTPQEWGQLLYKINKVDPVKYMVLPHDCFSTRPNSETIANEMKRESKIRVVEGETLAKRARLNRIAMTHKMLSDSPDGHPYMLIHSKCLKTIETIPNLIYDESKIEDLDSDGPDHWWDALSLGLITLKPRVSDNSSLVDMNQPRPKVPLKQTWGQNEDGEFKDDGILKALAQQTTQPNKGNIEF